MILKNLNNDTRLSGVPIEGWTEISQEELDAIRESRSVQPSPQAEVNDKKAAVRSVREGILNRLAGIALAAQLEGDTATTSAYITVRQGLLGITKNLPTDPELVDAEVMTRYASLAAQCTPQMVTAFAGVDA
jgi:hypothetical protein